MICSGTVQPNSPPLFSAPYAGYAEIASYLDHDLPDYAVDGKIILTTGLTVTGTPSAATFPDYWSPQLRQYIYYDGHNGYDYDIAYQPVLAAAAGTIAYANWESADPYYGYGQMILIKHVDGYETLYGHLSKLLVHPGERVSAGQEIAISGTTGHSTGPHLHFTVYHNCHVVDPYGWSGRGPDPIRQFNGESSTYLWKDGRAPLILNPLPGWPTFDSMLTKNPGLLQPPAPTTPLTHLLLLKLPILTPTSPDLVLAAFQSQLADEEEQVTQVLSAIENEGLITSFRLTPAAGAITVTGTIPASQLLGIPGVASVTGARAEDVTKARSGLTQATLAAVAGTATPSFFPSTYLDAEWMWRLSISAQVTGAHVFGFTQPLAPVQISVLRNDREVATATARGSVDRGLFEVAVTDRRGRQVWIRPGDLVRAYSLGRQASVTALGLSLWTGRDRNSLAGLAPGGAHVTAGLIDSTSGQSTTSPVSVAGSNARRVHRFAVRVANRVSPGDSISARLVEASGNTLMTWSRVPGFVLTEGSAQLEGWESPLSRWNVGVYGALRRHAGGSAIADGNGSVRILLKGVRGHTYALVPGDRVRLARGRSVSWLKIPAITGARDKSGGTFSGTAPRFGHVLARIWNDANGTWTTETTQSDRHGRYHIPIPSGAGPAALVDVLFSSPSGNLIRGATAMRGVVVHAQTGLITGHAGPGETLVVHVSNRRNHEVGTGLAATSPTSGSFAAPILDGRSKPLPLSPGDTVAVSDGQIVSNYTLPELVVKPIPGSGLEGWAPASSRPVATIVGGGRVIQIPLHVRDGYFSLPLAHPFAFPAGSIIHVVAGSAATGAVELDVPIESPAGLASGIIRAAEAATKSVAPMAATPPAKSAPALPSLNRRPS
ncbi:MAG TPA: M23 family metallopeptidase [Chloroflexota bacterium]|nr:M23 family metallopeptidase [Chloroflexota bacterium]